MNLEKYVKISQEVKEAIKEKKPVVALESTIISHGMPYPKNVETALEVEKVVRENGAIPATIAIINGEIKIGLSKEEIEIIGKAGLSVTKTSRRDLAYVVANKLNGATTVAATMICAQMANIKIFATGGIGGVHRGAEKTMDISADLEELGKTNVAVICAGCKSILDMGLTLEYLETKGVAVYGYKTNILPAFYTRESDFKVNKINSEQEVAKVLKTKWDLGLDGGVVITNPIPEEFSMDRKIIDKTILEALKEADEKGIKGKDITPFLLDKIQKLTSGKSLEANIELVFNNAKLASKIAIEYSKLD
jgi:hypothetical protein